MKPNHTFYIAIEKRYNFCLQGNEFKIYSRAYEHFRLHLESF